MRAAPPTLFLDKEIILNILALETSARRGGVAVLANETLLAAAEIDKDARTAAAITPLIGSTVRAADLKLPQIDLIAVTVGPGSFTGLRIGATTAKTLAYALDCEVLGVDTLEVIAQQFPDEICNAWALLDAQRQQLFVARFVRDETGRLKSIGPIQIVDQQAWLDELQPGDTVSGPGLRRIADRLPVGIEVVDTNLWQPRAASVGRVALHHYQAGCRDDHWKLLPQYYRRSAAEEKAENNPQ